MTNLSERLRALEAAATKGPWRAGLWGNGEHVPGLEHIFMDAAEITIQDVLSEDAALIVAMRNALPELLDTIDQQATRIEALERQVEGLRDHLGIAIADHDAHFGKATFVGHWTNLARAALNATKEEMDDGR